MVLCLEKTIKVNQLKKKKEELSGFAAELDVISRSSFLGRISHAL